MGYATRTLVNEKRVAELSKTLASEILKPKKGVHPLILEDVKWRMTWSRNKGTRIKNITDFYQTGDLSVVVIWNAFEGVSSEERREIVRRGYEQAAPQIKFFPIPNIEAYTDQESLINHIHYRVEEA